MYSIKKITAPETFPVRHPILRPGKPVESCHFEGDELDTTVHFGIYDDQEIAGCVSIFASASNEFAEESQFQMRGMAVLNNYQKQGLGRQLVEAAEQYVDSVNGPILWFNARESAVGFYKKMGYDTKGAPFDIPGVGMHFIMYKLMQP